MNNSSALKFTPYLSRILHALSTSASHAALLRVCFISLLLPFLLLVGCIMPDKDNASDAQNSASDIQLSNSKVYFSDINSQYMITATYVDADGISYLQQPAMQWFSSASEVATVDAGGVVTATGEGEAEITVSANGVKKLIQVVVNSQVITIAGQVRYEDREYGAGGFIVNPDYFKSVRFARVDLITEDNQIADTTFTDKDGRFVFSAVFNTQYKITVYTDTDTSQGLDLSVKDLSDRLFAITANVTLDSQELMSIDIPLSSEASGAFNILDVFTTAADFTITHTSLSTVSLTGFWQENNSDGTYYCEGYDSVYCSLGKGVYIYHEDSADTDEYDDDVLYHEFGHYFLDSLSRDDSEGGCHFLSSRDLDLRLAWSEGFGSFFPAAVKRWLSSDNDRSTLLSSTATLPNTTYVDTFRSGAQINIDLNNLNPNLYSSAGNEMAIASLLFDMYQRYGMQALLTVLTDYLPTVATPVNLESFWDGWLQLHQPDAGGLAALQAIFNERKVYYQYDAFESDDVLQGLTRSPITYNSAETHYLYNPVSDGEDVDLIPFIVNAGSHYEIETRNLSGGTDTHISILDSQGNALWINGVTIANDDHTANVYYVYDTACGASRVKNDATALASRVEFTAPTSGTYYVEIRATIDSAPYLSAGRYGSYDVLVR